MKITSVIFRNYPLAAEQPERAIRNPSHCNVVRYALINLKVAQLSSKITTENHIVRLVLGKTTYYPVLNIVRRARRCRPEFESGVHLGDPASVPGTAIAPFLRVVHQNLPSPSSVL